jgi:hypothetical protein
VIKDLPLIIAEVKTESPFGWKSDKSWEELIEVADKVGDMISIHTNPLWGGSMELISQARKLSDKPILAKGLHESDTEVREALDAGARWVLVVGRECEVDPSRTLYEPYTFKQLTELPAYAKRTVWNARDLRNGGKAKDVTFEEARAARAGWMCQASHIKTVEDIHPGAQAVLVGTSLELFAASVRAFRNTPSSSAINV